MNDVVSVVGDADHAHNDESDNADISYDNYTDQHLEAESHCMTDNNKTCAERERERVDRREREMKDPG